jgi:type IV pilus assembly protein PilQ
MSILSITVEDTTRSIIVRGHEPDLDTIDAVIREIDIKTKQVLIEAFIVEANSKFANALGARVGAMSVSERGAKGTTTISGLSGGAATDAAGIALGSAAGSISNQAITGGTSGIGILKQVGARALKLELEALESLTYNKILSQPSVFTLNNQEATITQGEQIPYQTTADGTTTTAFKEAALSLTVTPSIIGDGNVLLDIKVNNDSPNLNLGDEPGINTNAITTKLLVSDGDIVVIGGIKKRNINNVNSKTPGVSKLPVLGNLFKSKTKTDDLTDLLIFIAPRVIE